MSISAIALSGMNAAQTGLQVAAHNIANLNTAGFRRQQVLQPKSGSYPVAGSQVGGLNGARVGAILSLT